LTALVLVVLLAAAGAKLYHLGQDSQAQTISDLKSDLGKATGNAERLQDALADANAKVLQFEANQKPDLAKKEALQELAKVEAGKGVVRVKAAQAVTTNTDDVLRTYWESYGQ